uniref:C2H2-type domain-containing protein n=1 Tax=Phaeocystis antarctica TaxID=33657 RepID=A0A6T7NTN1_9EUKA|mmetsp:Transcript_14838/g.35049  ORF Transcript_14838/g.35049 Transcript_14838/m.35049 type:complete len:121 (+) Transcript_14838:297-659(+)
MGFRCAHCCHLFGVDLIADAHRQLHVIEVNIAPDLTLSTEGACAATAHGCVGGSSIYDRSVHLLFSPVAAATTLHAMLTRATLVCCPRTSPPSTAPRPPLPRVRRRCRRRRRSSSSTGLA